MNKLVRINVFCYLTIGLLGVYISAYQGIISELSKDYSISAALTGFIISLHFIGSAVAPAVFGEIGDRVGKKSAVIAAGIIYIVGLTLVYLSRDLFTAAVGIFFIGSGFGVLEGMLSGVLADFNRASTNRVINISQMFFGIGAIAGPVLALQVTALTDNWRGTFLFVAAASTFILIFAARLDFRTDSGCLPDGNALRPGLIIFELLKDGTFILYCAGVFLYVGIEEGVAFWTTSYFKNMHGSVEMGAYALACYWGIMILGRFIGSILADRPGLLIYSGLSITFVSLLVVLVSNDRIMDFSGFIGIGLGLSVIWPVLMSAAAEKYPKYTGTAMGIMMTFSALGGIILPFVTGFASELSGINGAFRVFPLLVAMIFIMQLKCFPLSKVFKKY